MKKGTRITYYVESLSSFKENDTLICRYCKATYLRSDNHNFDDCVENCQDSIMCSREEIKILKNRLEEEQGQIKKARRALNKAKKIQAENWWKVPFAIKKMNRTSPDLWNEEKS